MIAFLLALFSTALVSAEEGGVAAAIDARQDEFAAVAHQIWEYAELGYLEERSSALLKSKLADAGFEIRSGIGERGQVAASADQPAGQRDEVHRGGIDRP